MVTSPSLPCADFAAACCWQKYPREPTETQSQNNSYSCGKRVKFTSWLEGLWDISIQHLQAEERELGSR